MHNLPPSPSSSSLLSRIQAAHQRCKRGSNEAIAAAVECGLLLLELRKLIKHGEWTEVLQSINFPPRTAWNYVQIAKRCQGKLLKDGIYFCNLLREPEFGLLPPLEGGGGRLGKKELERRRQAEQMLFHFEKVVEPALEEVLRYDFGNPLGSVPADKVQRVRLAGEKLLRWADEAGGAIDV